MSEFDKLYAERSMLIEEECNLLKPLAKLTAKNKVVMFSLFIYGVRDKIKKRCEEFVKEYFDENSILQGEAKEIYVANLVMDLNYMFTQALWLIKISKRLKIVDASAKKYICEDIIDYQEQGWKAIVCRHVPKYNKNENRLYSDKEFNAIREKGNKIAGKMLKEILAEEKNKAL